MKVRVPLVIEVDPQKWAEINGEVADENGKYTSAADVREDIRKFVLNLVQQATTIEDAEAEVAGA